MAPLIHRPNMTPSSEQQQQHLVESDSSHLRTTLWTLGATIFFGLHGAMLFSLPPVLKSRGAPYLPTFQREVNSIFQILQSYCTKTYRATHLSLPGDDFTPKPAPFTFVDLGSGDGRLVFRAAREHLFRTCIGYEINPVLHLWVSIWRLLQPNKYYTTTQFYLQDIWTVNLSTHGLVVVTVYGLYPIMKRLGEKLKQELQPGSIVVSLFFEIPGWKSTTVSSVVGSSNHTIPSNIYIYIVPSCWT